MLEKSLPFFRQNPPKPEPSLENQQNNSSTYGSGPNLVYHQDYTAPLVGYSNKITSILKKWSFALTIVFGIGLCFNYYLDLRLASRREIINQLATEVGNYTDTRSKAIDIDKKSNFYKNTLSTRALLGEKAHDTFSNLNPQTVLQQAALYPDKFMIEVEVSSPLEFAQLVARYLQSKHISSLSLQSADLVASRQVYRVVMQGTYK